MYSKISLFRIKSWRLEICPIIWVPRFSSYVSLCVVVHACINISCSEMSFVKYLIPKIPLFLFWFLATWNLSNHMSSSGFLCLSSSAVTLRHMFCYASLLTLIWFFKTLHALRSPSIYAFCSYLCQYCNAIAYICTTIDKWFHDT